MKNLKNITRAFVIHTMIFSLLQTSFIFSVEAAEKNNSDITSKDILGAANIALATYGQFLGAKQQMVQQQISAQRNQQMMQQLSPGCRKPDGTACYTVAGQFFPECPIPASMTAMPQNVCSAASPDPSAISSMLTYEQIAKTWVNYFDQMMNEASNSKTPFGMKCLQDKQKALDSQLTEMVNNLTRLQDQLNKDKEIFKANNKKLLEDMRQTNDELMGSSGGNNLALKTKDFSKYFSPTCQSVITSAIGEDALSQGAVKGLNGIMQDLSPAGKRAADYNSNKSLIEADLRRDVEKIQRSIANSGLQDYFDGKIAETSKFQSLMSATQKQSGEFKLAKDRIAKELGKIGYELPVMDKNFSVDFEEFLSGSTSFFKKQYINDCVTGADKSGTAISTDQILASLKQKSTNNNGTARDKYKAALQTILNSDAFIEDKLNQIKALESTYQDISITYNNASAQRVTSTPYDLYMKTLEACEGRYAQDDTFSAGGKNGVSQKKKVERGQALLRDLKSLHDNFSSDLGSRILEQVISCNGEAKKSGAACGDKNSFNSESPTFCMAQSNQCANEVSGCMAEASKHVETRKAKLENSAKVFNANAAALVARSNALYKAQTNAVMNMVKVVQARFPGTNFEIPAGMFISMPELKKDSFGVDLVNDGNVAFMDELPKKIDLLKKVFKDQQTAANDQIKQYIEKQNMAMARERDRWNALAGECKGMIDTSSREVAKMNNENMKKQAELDNKVRNFCRKYNALASHPVGGCENAKKLSGEMDDVMSRVLPTVTTNINEFNGVCNAYGNEANDTSTAAASSLAPSAEALKCKDTLEKSGADEQVKAQCRLTVDADNKRLKALLAGPASKKGKKGNSLSLNSLCGSNGKNDNTTFIDKLLSKFSPEEQKKLATGKQKDAIIDAFKTGDFDKVEGLSKFEDDDAITDLANLTGRLKGNDQICEKLHSIDNPKPTTTKVKDPAKVAAATKAKEAYDKFFDNNKEYLDRNGSRAQEDTDTRNKISAIDIKARTQKQQADLDEVLKGDKIREEAEKLLKADKTAQVDTDKSESNISPADSAKKLSLELVINKLSKAASVEASPAETRTAELTRIGEQVEGNTVCDAQAANNNITKAFQGGLLPAGFDAGILGQSR